MSKRSKTSGIVRVFFVIAIIGLLLGSIGLIFSLTNGFREDMKTFYVKYDNKILPQEYLMEFSRGNSYEFSVGYISVPGKEATTDYTVKLIPNSAEDFEFFVDGVRCLYSNENDLTSSFDIVITQTGFIISIPRDQTISTILQTLYEGDVVVPESDDHEKSYLYELQVSSYDGKTIYNIYFCLKGITRISLDCEGVIF